MEAKEAKEVMEAKEAMEAKESVEAMEAKVDKKNKVAKEAMVDMMNKVRPVLPSLSGLRFAAPLSSGGGEATPFECPFTWLREIFLMLDFFEFSAGNEQSAKKFPL